MQEQLFKNYTTSKIPYSIKDLLMNAAEKLFLEKGVAATSVTDILTASKQAKNAFYDNYNCKEELVADMRARYDRRISAELLREIDKIPINQSEKMLKAWIETYIKLYINSYHIYDIMYDNSSLNRYKKNQTDPVLNVLIDTIENGNIEGIWSIEEPRLAAAMIKAGVHAIADEFIGDIFSNYQDYYQIIYNYCRKMLR
ncbi:TetR/AcrR family transcriptional regulator [Orbaceae bacterium ac157xtp]